MSKVLFVSDRPDAWKHGIWWHRIQIPSNALANRGHSVKQVSIGMTFPQELLEWPDTVIFGRAYDQHFEPVKWMKEYKRLGKRVLYDMDDDFWQVAKDNPSVRISNTMKDQYEGMIEVADAIISPSKILLEKFKKHFKKPTFIAPNCADEKIYIERPHGHKNELVIGYMGASSHFKDLQIIGEAISKLSRKYAFTFSIYGLVGEPLEAAIYSMHRYYKERLMPERDAYHKAALDFSAQIQDMRVFHTPFMPPELHPTVLNRCDFDIGLAPLEDTEFNRGKSCIKFYEYVKTGTVVLASDVEPYKSEVNYRAKNTVKDWYDKLEKLIVSHEFREKIFKQQKEWVDKNRSLEEVGKLWEKAIQKPGGLKTLN